MFFNGHSSQKATLSGELYVAWGLALKDEVDNIVYISPRNMFIGDHLVTRADLEGISPAFTVTLTALTKQMVNLENELNNTNNNENQRRDKGGEHVKIMRGGNNHRAVIVESLSSQEEEHYKEDVVDHGFFDVMGIHENRQVKMVAIMLESIDVVWWDKRVVKRQRQKGMGQLELGEE
ncbi:hypothetical protein KIW84_054093 [Lathyrus oleraceus]|uniref:Uncharacterized protein n=1 Tax=Pisum sativum TaxID=3888 RepID=A0A9D4WS62_PEA|nr:hypothetical protein KIW84_054093 [Pisum sativum]